MHQYIRVKHSNMALFHAQPYVDPALAVKNFRPRVGAAPTSAQLRAAHSAIDLGRAGPQGARMKTIALLLCLAVSASAEHIIYRSIGRQTIYGNGKIVRVTVQGYLVVDANTIFGGPIKATAVGGFSLNGVKAYSVVPLQSYRLDTVIGPKGTTYTIVAKAESPGTQFAGVLLESVYLRGRNQALQIAPQATAQFPRVFSSSARAIAQLATKTAGEVSGSYTYDHKNTFVSNQLETFDQAVTRFSNGFAGKGYIQVFPAPAQ